MNKKSIFGKMLVCITAMQLLPGINDAQQITKPNNNPGYPAFSNSYDLNSSNESQSKKVLPKQLNDDKQESKVSQETSSSSATNSKAVNAAPITGKITGAGNTPMEGVSVTVKGTSRGTSSKADGSFSISAEKGDILVFSHIGYELKQVTVGDESTINVTLLEGSSVLNEVVVTALGIQRQSKGLTYSTQKVAGSELTQVKEVNLANSLSGKVAGLTVNRSASGAGGSVKVVMRGNKSTQNNSPLYVIDGIPMTNNPIAQPDGLYGQSAGVGSGGRDGGDAISNLNPEDIESVQTLKGASAAALYGSMAANGAIVITTKKGKAGQARINVGSSLQMDNVVSRPELQFKYGQKVLQTATDAGSEDGWGNAVNNSDFAKDYYQTGLTSISNIGFSAGNDKALSYFSYSFTDNKGVIPSSTFKRHTLTFKESAKFFDDKLSLDGFVTLTKQQASNRPVSGLYNNPLVGVDMLPRNFNLSDFKNNYSYLSGSRQLNMQNWWDINYDKGWAGDETSQNPYWLTEQNSNDDGRERAFTSLTLKYALKPWLAVQARGSYDYYNDHYESKMYAGTSFVLSDFNGRYSVDLYKNAIAYGDALLLINKDLTKNLSLNASFGGAILDAKVNQRTFMDSYGATTSDGNKWGLGIANVFTLQNILPNNATKQQEVTRYQTQSILASASLGYKEMLYLDLTGRNDWSSTLAYTPNQSYFYYSAGATAVITELLKLPAFFSSGKVRVSYAKVGNSVKAFATYPPLYTINASTGALEKVVKGPFPGHPLKPEDNRSFEAGTAWSFLKNRLGIDFTYYKNNNYDQYFETPAPAGSGFQTYYLNLGNIQNQGFEVMLTGTPIKGNDFSWNTGVNFAMNKNKVIKLSEPGVTSGTPRFYLTGFDKTYGTIVQEGGQFGDIISNVAERDANGNIIYGADSLPLKASDPQVVGNPNPKFTLGWNNEFTYKHFTLNFLFDGRFGGKVMSITQAVLDGAGFSQTAASARDNGGVQISGVDESGKAISGKIGAEKYYVGTGGLNGFGEFYMYDATIVRLRELSLGYNVPLKSTVFHSLSISLTGRNLFYMFKKAPFDPEVSLATNDKLQGVDVFGLPATRSFGLNVKVGL